MDKNAPQQRHLYFNIFHKDNSVFLIIPFYTKSTPDLSQISLFHDAQELSLKSSWLKHTKPAISVLEYYFDSVRPNNDLTLVYKQNKTRVILHQELSKPTAQGIALTTLFKDDFYLVDRFYNYYKTQGVDHFYLYYNGLITDEIAMHCDKPEITLLEWNYHYWNDDSADFPHHAQIGQMHDALYRYGKNNYEYMAFCDLDEYMHVPGQTLKAFIQGHNYDKIGFQCYWTKEGSVTLKNHIPRSALLSEPLPFPRRAKCIYKADSVNLLGIHDSELNQNCNNVIQSLMLLHFRYWSRKRGEERDKLELNYTRFEFS